MRYLAKSFDSNLPEEIHFCGLVFEVAKQILVSNKYFSSEYVKIKRKHNV